METPRKTTLKPDPDQIRVEIPQVVLKRFQETPRILIKWRPDGIWPIPPELFRNPEFWKEIAADKEFNAKFEVVVMAR